MIDIVQQNIFLFSDTIENNISLRKGEITQEQSLTAAKEVHLDKFVQQMPDSYATEVKEDGSGLSRRSETTGRLCACAGFRPWHSYP